MIRIAAAISAAIALTSAPVAPAATRFITVALPPSADLTTYGWCDGFGCHDPLRMRAPRPTAVYDAITAIDTSRGRRVAAIDAYGLGAWATAEAVRRLVASGVSDTTVAAILLGTPTRPSGGLFTRIDGRSATPPANFNAFGGGAPPGAPFDVSVVDVAREFDGLADAPSWFNPLAMVNAMAGAVFLRDYNDTVTWRDPRCPNGTCVAPATWPVTLPSATGPVYAMARVPDPANPAATMDISSPEPVGVAVVPTSGDRTVYYTQFTRILPLLMPLQLPFDVLNRVVAAVTQGAVQPQLVNPLVQMLDAPLRVLVNLGYPDVDPANGFTRTHTSPGEHVPFGTPLDLTPAQWGSVPQAVGEAVQHGVRDAVERPFGTDDEPDPTPAQRVRDEPTPKAANEPEPKDDEKPADEKREPPAGEPSAPAGDDPNPTPDGPEPSDASDTDSATPSDDS